MSLRMLASFVKGPALPAAAALLLAACTCAGKPGQNPAPQTTATTPAAAPATPEEKPAIVELPPRPAASDAGTPAPGTDKPKTATAARADGGAQPQALPTVPAGGDPVKAKHKEHLANCDRFVASLGGPGATRELSKAPEMKRIAAQSQTIAQYLACRAIELGDVTRCELVETADTRVDCRERFDRFRELKSGGGKSWLFTETEYQICKTLPMADACDAFREMAKTGDVNRCPKGDYEGFCRALFNLDRSQCHATGPHAKAVEKICQQRIDEKEKDKGGLQSIARTGSLVEQAFARAAMGEKGACEDFALKLSEACTNNLDLTDQVKFDKPAVK